MLLITIDTFCGTDAVSVRETEVVTNVADVSSFLPESQPLNRVRHIKASGNIERKYVIWVIKVGQI